MTQTALNHPFTFLQELQEELNTQETDAQAAPIFWSILNYHSVPAMKGNHDHIMLHLSEEGQTVLLDAYVDMLLHHQKEEMETKEALEELKIMWEDPFRSEEDVLEWIKTYKTEDAELLYEKEESFVAPDTFFLTKKEAQGHLKQNHYHYHPKAHTYAMTAWRAPKVAQLFTLLQTFDWASLAQMKAEHAALTEEVHLLRAFAHEMKDVVKQHKEDMKALREEYEEE